MTWVPPPPPASSRPASSGRRVLRWAAPLLLAVFLLACKGAQQCVRRLRLVHQRIRRPPPPAGKFSRTDITHLLSLPTPVRHAGTPPSWQGLTLQPVVGRLSGPGRPAPLPKVRRRRRGAGLAAASTRVCLASCIDPCSAPAAPVLAAALGAVAHGRRAAEGHQPLRGRRPPASGGAEAGGGAAPHDSHAGRLKHLW